MLQLLYNSNINDMIIFISVLILLGIMGNVHVIYIYYRFFTTSTYRIFVLSLAVIDMVSCVISMPFEISDELNPYMFQDEISDGHPTYIPFRSYRILEFVLIFCRKYTKPEVFEISDELNPYMFQDEIACKVFRFVNFTLAITTGLMLVVIASERYRRICRPQGKQLNERESLYALIGVVACASGG
jgi:hypothetical protein